MTYHASTDATPPAILLPQLASTVGMSVDDLFGRETKRKLVKQKGDIWLCCRLLAIDRLEVAEKRQVLQVMDAFLERG